MPTKIIPGFPEPIDFGKFNDEKDNNSIKRAGGLIGVVAQDWKTNEVYMIGYMNPEALEKTLEKGRMFYWSRSRRKLWDFGASSGKQQIVKQIYVGCENDSLLFKVEQLMGYSCHTGYRSCFYRQLKDGSLEIIGNKVK